jgi:hypothetical protein
VRRLVLGLTAAVVVLAGLGGCGVLGAAAGSIPPAAATTPSPLPSRPTTTTPAISVAKPRSAAPALATAGTAWPKVLASLNAYGQWLLANPNPALVGSVTTPGCPVAVLVSQQMQSLINDNAYVVTTPPTVTAITGPASASGQVVLMVTAARPGEPVLSRGKGSVTIGRYSAVPAASFEVTLDQGADGKWRYCTIENQPDETDAAVPLL